MQQSEKAKAIRQRLKDDFEFWAEHAAKIRTQKGETQPLILNAVQRRLLDLIEEQLSTTGMIRIVVLKARQQGFSTFVSAYLYFLLSQSTAKKGLVVAHKGQSTDTLFAMYKRLHAECPPVLKPATSYSGRKELVFSELDTGVMVATAGGDEIARGETLNFVHLSEVAHWPKINARNNFVALEQAIPNEPGTVVIVESTPNGQSGVFYDLWQGAVAGTNGYVPFFSAWYESPEKRVAVPEGFERTLEEEDLARIYGLDDEQLCFRRMKIALSGFDAFQQEHPSNPEDCFLASGRPVFDPQAVSMILQNCQPPLAHMAMDIDGTWREDRFGKLLVYHPLDAGERYTIGADVALGTPEGDWSVACVMDSKRRQVAIYRDHVDPEHFGTILDALGRHYNNARIAVESNIGYGMLSARVLRDLSYPNLFTDVREGELADRETSILGFRTTAKTKPLIIGELIAELRAGGIEINDRQTAVEMQTYIVTGSNKTEAEPGCHDDCVMALAIANHVLERHGPPIEMTDEWYVPAIG